MRSKSFSALWLCGACVQHLVGRFLPGWTVTSSPRLFRLWCDDATGNAIKASKLQRVVELVDKNAHVAAIGLHGRLLPADSLSHCWSLAVQSPNVMWCHKTHVIPA